MKKILFSILFLGILVLPFTLPLTASAQFGAAKTELAKVAGKTGLEGNFETSIGTIIKGALSLVGTIFLILTVYAGYLWMTASGNEEQVTKAKDIVTQAIIGLAITLGAYAITTFVTGRLAQSSGDGGSGIQNLGNACTVDSECGGNNLVCSNTLVDGSSKGICITQCEQKYPSAPPITGGQCIKSAECGAGAAAGIETAEKGLCPGTSDIVCCH